MKSPLGKDRKISSALLFATISWLTASLLSSLAIPAAARSPEIANSSNQGFLPSTGEPAPKLVSQPSAGSLAIAAAERKTPAQANSAANAANASKLAVPSWQAQADLPAAELEAPAEDSMSQVTNVSQLKDVQPTDWAYSALRDLVERYGCIAGYPDGFFRGNRSLSRYEFAAGINACLKQIERLLPKGTPDSATRQDLESLQRLTQEFQAEIATLSTRTDKLEARTTSLENRQFSTTTKLFGQVIFGVQGHTTNTADLLPVDKVKETSDPFATVNVVGNAQLSLFTQLSDRSILLTGLQAGQGFTGSLYNTFTTLAYEGNTNGAFAISDLTYRQLVGNNFAFIVGAVGVNPINVFRGANRIESAGSGPLSRFAQRNPIVGIGNGQGGVGFDWQLGPSMSLQAVYAVSQPGVPSGGGVFGNTNNENSIGAQFNISPADNLDIAFHYINAYSPFGRLGAGIGDDTLAVPTFDIATGSQKVPLQTNAYGASLEWRISQNFTFGGWGGFTNSIIPGQGGNVETINWMAFLNFPDLFGEGNLGGLYVGQPPRISASNLSSGRNIPGFFANFLGDPGARPGTTTHVEAFYRFRVSDNISITPGVIVLFAPGHTPSSDTITIGALRTTFAF